MGRRRREGDGRQTRGPLRCRPRPGAVLALDPAGPFLLGTRHVVGFPSCPQEFGARDFPDCAGAGRGPSNLLAASDVGVVSPRRVTSLLGKAERVGSAPPSTTATLAASPGAAEERDARWRSPPFAGEQTRASAKPEEMILRPQSRGDPAVPVRKGTKPSWRSRTRRRSVLLCALRGYNQGVMLDSAPSTESGAATQAAALTLPLCVCVRARVCESGKKGSSPGAGGLCGVHAQTDAWDLSHGPCRGDV